MKKSVKRNQKAVISFAIVTITLVILTTCSQSMLFSQATMLCCTTTEPAAHFYPSFLNDFYEISATEDHKLTLLEYSHYNQPIYPNYTTVDFAVAFEGDEFDMADVSIHYTNNAINWTSKEFTRIKQLSPNSTLFEVTIGPFLQPGDYTVKINATRGSVEHSTINFIMPVEEIKGLVFLDFDHQIIKLDNKTDLVNIQITVLGNGLLNDSVQILVDQTENNLTDMVLIEGFENRFNATMGSINHWEQYVHITFSANTTMGKIFNNTNYLFKKDIPRFEEPFLTSLLPAILVAVLAFGSMTTIFIMAKRRAPKKFDIEASDDEELKEKLRKKMKRARKKKNDSDKKLEEDLF